MIYQNVSEYNRFSRVSNMVVVVFQYISQSVSFTYRACDYGPKVKVFCCFHFDINVL